MGLFSVAFWSVCFSVVVIGGALSVSFKDVLSGSGFELVSVSGTGVIFIDVVIDVGSLSPSLESGAVPDPRDLVVVGVPALGLTPTGVPIEERVSFPFLEPDTVLDGIDFVLVAELASGVGSR